MSENPERSIIVRPDAQIEKWVGGGNRVLAAMVEETLSVARRESHAATRQPKARFKIAGHDWAEPDYRQILAWAEELTLTPETVIARLLDDRSLRNPRPGGHLPKWAGTRFEQGRITSLHWDLELLPIPRFRLDGDHLAIEALSFSPADSQPELLLPKYREIVKELSIILPTLRFLACRHLGLTEIRLAGVSNLEELRCSNNKLSTLDLSHVPHLSSLFCGSNAITRLNLSDVTGLQSLDCGWSDISTLDLSPVPNLLELDCSFTEVAHLDLSQVEALEHLACQSTSITMLNLSEVPFLSYLDFTETEISELDLSGVPNLDRLFCSQTNITSLNLSSVKCLTALFCDETEITELDIRSLAHLETLIYDQRSRLIQRPDQKFTLKYNHCQ